MKKIMIIGCPGSGKSTFARRLHKITNIPIYHLDMIWNKPDQTTISREEFDEKLEEIFKQECWIMDGNYQRTLEKRLPQCDTVYLLDYPLELCLAGATQRVGVKRADLPWVEQELNEAFKQKIIDFSKDKLPKIYELLEQYKQTKEIYIFKTREQSEQYLCDLESKQV